MQKSFGQEEASFFCCYNKEWFVIWTAIESKEPNGKDI
jgi:hypothetical protein